METRYFPWALITQWPADGSVKRLKKWKIAAVHIAATTISKEKIILKQGRYRYQIQKVGNKWTLPKKI